jgi:hypothetical protein
MTMEQSEYKSLNEWKLADKKAYDAARSRGMLQDICDMFGWQIKTPNILWTLDKLKQDALKYNTKAEWRKNSSSAYVTAKTQKLLDVCCEHMDVLWKNKWTLEIVKKDAILYKTKKEWKYNSPNAYNAACDRGWYKECIQHMISDRKPDGYWTLDNCKENALLYKTKTEWRENSLGAYDKAKTNRWLKDCCSHMETPLKEERGHWMIKENCQKAASSCSTRNEFRKKYGRAYAFSKENGWFDDLCKHMK